MKLQKNFNVNGEKTKLFPMTTAIVESNISIKFEILLVNESGNIKFKAEISHDLKYLILTKIELCWL